MEPSCEATKCATISTSSVTTVNPLNSVIIPSHGVSSSLLLTNRPLIILSDSMLASCLAQSSLPRNLYSSMNLLSHPPEVTELPPAIDRQLCLPSVGYGRTITTIDSTLPVLTGLEDPKLLSEGNSEVCVIPDSPPVSSVTTVPSTDKEEIALSENTSNYGEAIMNALTTSIVSLSKQNPPCDSKMIETFQAQKEPEKIPFFNLCHSKLMMPNVLHKYNQNMLVEFVAEKEQLLEDSDNELEVSPLLDNEKCEQNNGHSPCIEEEHCIQSSPILNATRVRDENQSDSDNKTEICEEPSAKKRKLETNELILQSDYGKPILNQASIDINEIISTLPVRVDQETFLPPTIVSKKTLLPPSTVGQEPEVSLSLINHEPGMCSMTINQESAPLSTKIDQEATLPSMTTDSISVLLPTVNEQAILPKSFPREPTEMANDGLETTNAALPTECAQEHPFHPNVPYHPQHDYDSSDDDEENAQPVVRPFVNEPAFPEQAHEMSPSSQQTSFSPVLEYQVVPDVSPLDSSFLSKSLYLDEQDNKMKTKEPASGDMDSDSEHASVLAFALQRLDQQNKTTQTVCPSPPSDDDSRSVRGVSKQQNYFFRQNTGIYIMCTLCVGTYYCVC